MKRTLSFYYLLALLPVFSGISGCDSSKDSVLGNHYPAVFPKYAIPQGMEPLTAYIIDSKEKFDNYFNNFSDLPAIDFSRESLIYIHGGSANQTGNNIGYKIEHTGENTYTVYIRIYYPGMVLPALDRWCCPILVRDIPDKVKINIDFDETGQSLPKGYRPIRYVGYDN